jgi:tetratricopeptide (TPR) repeat protein
MENCFKKVTKRGKKMKKFNYVCLLVILFVVSAGSVFSQTINKSITLYPNQTILTQKNGNNYETGFWGVGKHIFSPDTYIDRSYYEFDLSSIEDNATITNVEVNYSMSGTSYTFKLTKIASLYDSLHAMWDSIGTGEELHTGLAYSIGSSFDSSPIKTSLAGALVNDQLIIGALSEAEGTTGSESSLDLSFYVEYTISAQLINLTVRNDLYGADGGYIGMAVYPYTAVSRPSPFPFTAYEENRLNLAAYDNQTVNGKVWFFNNTEYPDERSEWKKKKDLVYTHLEYLQSFSTGELTVSDDNATFIAYLKTTTYTTSGTMSSNETWFTSPVTLTGNVTVPSGVTLEIKSGVSVSLNGNNIISAGGTITVESGVTINSSNSHTRLITGSAIKGIYSTIASAMSAAASGQSIYVYGTHDVSNNLTVPSGITLSTKSGSQMNIASDKYIYVYGGFYGNNTTYTSSSGTWNGIRYYSGSSGSIQYANISNASVGVYASYSNPVVSYTNISDCGTGVRPFHSNMTLSNSTIDNCNYGVYAQSGSPDINNSSISNCTYGIRLSQSSAQITSNEITGCTRGIYGYYADMTKIVNNLIATGSSTSNIAGVQFYNSNEPNMYNNTINGYCSYLLDADHYSRPLAIGPGSQNYQGYNRMMGGSTATIYAHDHSEVVFGTGFTQSTDGYAGYNTIYLDIGTDRFAHVRAYTYSNVIAQKNYWGDYPPVDFVADGSSDIDYSYALSTDPGGGSTLGKMSGTYTEDAITENVNTHDMEPDEKLWMEAGEYWQNLNYRKALETYNILLNNYSDSPYASRAFLRSVYAKRARKSADIEEYLQKYVNTPNLRTMTLEMLIGEDIRRNRYEGAIDKIKTVISENPDSEAEYKALFTLFNVYHMNMDDQNKAAAVLEQMKTRYGDHGLTQIAQYDMGEPVEWKVDEPIEFGEEKPEPNLASTSHYRLDKNSPNPFNPVTRIDFELPEAAFTKLTVYDLLGREVRKLVNGHMEPGSHHVTWDGRNDTGKILPNGVYICVLKANDFKATRKMILLK